jgi:hypothetical protein
MEWLRPAIGTTILWSTLKTDKAMKKRIIILIFGLFSVVSLQAQFAKPLKSRNYICRNTGSLSFGITGSFAANDMIYSAVSKSKLTPYLVPTFGLAAEWNTMRRVSVGLDASYAMRGTHEVFATEFLTNYSSTTFARVHYTMAMNGVEVRIPITYYLGYGENLRPYLFVAPRFDLWMNGNAKWERTYDDNSYQPVVYETELTNATIMPFDVSAVAGVGLCSRVMVKRTQFFVKLDVSYGISVLSNFSQHEVNEDVTFQGWGDIEHETLGLRYLQNVEARLTLLVPLRKFLKDACAFEQKTKKGK